MTASVDGTIRIDTKIDQKGFDVGTRHLTSNLKGLGSRVSSTVTGLAKLKLTLIGLAAAFGLFLGLQAFVQFLGSSVSEASKLSSALIGLESIVNGTGNSLVRANKFLDDYTKDGLVPATNAITAYKNLLMRGYDTSQIETTMLALKNSSAFGRQSHLTMGEAIQSATEGLKNENSILVDNAGVTKNVSMMWKDYAEELGIGVGSLTKAQKIQAEVNGIMNETRFQMGDAAKLSKTYSGQISALGVAMLNLKVSIGKAIIPVITAILPYIRAAVEALTVFFNRVALIVSILFGVDISQGIGQTNAAMDDSAVAATDASKAQDKLAGSTKKAGKEAKGALASFDKLNVLQQSMGDEDGAGGAGAGDLGDLAGIGGGAAIEMPGLDTTEMDASLEELRAKVETAKARFIEFFTPAIEGFNRFKEALAPLGQTIWSGLQWAWENILKPLGEWAVQSATPAVFDLLAAGATILNDVLTGLKPLGEWLWENFLKPLGEWAADNLIAAIQQVTEWLEKLHVWISNNEQTWQSLLWILAIVAGVMLLVLAPISATTIAIGALIVAIIWLIANWKQIAPAFANTWKLITDNWGKAGDWFKNIADQIKTNFNTSLDFVRNAFSNAFSGIVSIVRNSINKVIEFINGMLSRISSGFGALSTIGGAFGIKIPTFAVPQIPYLATGAVIPPNSQFVAMLGDQRSGKNIEAPENLIRQIVREEAGNMQTSVNIKFEGTIGELVRILKPQIEKETKRNGTSLAQGAF